MGYTIKIGNAEPKFSKDDGYLDARWEVESRAHGSAPTFPHDEMTGNGNDRSPSYSAWADTCRATGLYELFYADDEGLIRPHPGCRMLLPEHLLQVQAALERQQRVSTLPPGFEGWPIAGADGVMTTPDEGKYDPVLARLIWLEWWMKWALENCETPAIENY